jgi:ABC-type phosphate/phosphonate transport system ATPase subunit
MIELLGIGVPRPGGGWLLHRVCATLEAGELTVVTSADAAERHALLDAITGRPVATEGRVWIDRVPVMAATSSRVRRLCAEIDPAAGLVERRSLFWNALAPAAGPRALGRLLRLPRRGEREAVLAALQRVGLGASADAPLAGLSPFDRMRFLIARALVRRPLNLVVRELDAAVGPEDVGGLLALLRLLARHDRLGIVVGLRDGAGGQGFADRVLVVGEGLLLFHGRPEQLGERHVTWRTGALGR